MKIGEEKFLLLDHHLLEINFKVGFQGHKIFKKEYKEILYYWINEKTWAKI